MTRTPAPATVAPGRPPRQRSGGRSELVRAGVAEAVLSLLREGRSGFSVAEVAERAGVHRTTVYRWWPTPTDLLREALTAHGARLTLPDTGSWPADVAAALEQLAGFLADPVELALTAAFAAGDDPEGNRAQRDYWRPIEEQLERLVHRAIGRGELATDVDPASVALLITGPVFAYTLAYRAVPPPDLLERLASAVTRGFGD